MRYLLGIDLGSSSVKVSLVDVVSGRCAASASYPDREAPIKALRPGWAEQNPDDWWQYLKAALSIIYGKCPGCRDEIGAIGISYQMHGLVCVDSRCRLLRDAIIWCDSRGVPYGERAFDAIGHERCLSHLLNSPGNFTATKLAWVKENEPELYGKIDKVMLPGDWLAMRMGCGAQTTRCGLSEMMLYDYAPDRNSDVAGFLMDYFGFRHGILPSIVPTFGQQGTVSAAAAAELGLKAGTPITYRAGDQPNNALSLNVMEPGEIASTAGTSGVVYGVTDSVDYDPLSRINVFLHVNDSPDNSRLGLMHCINGCGILNAWLHRNVAYDMSYDEMNAAAATVPPGSDGVTVIPFGNGTERVLQNRDIGCSVLGLNFNFHGRQHLLRAAHEGIAFAFCYGIEIMTATGLAVKSIHAGNANLYLSPIFRQTVANICGASIMLSDSDGSVGAALGAGIGANLFKTRQEAFHGINCVTAVAPNADEIQPCQEAYNRWKRAVEGEVAEKLKD